MIDMYRSDLKGLSIFLGCVATVIIGLWFAALWLVEML